MAEQAHRFVVIGGGISGLTSAFYINQYCKRHRIAAEITLLEKGSALGGKINTLHRDGFVIEKGPDSFLARKQAMIDLARDLELEHDLVATNPEAKKTYIWHEGKLRGMPPGLVLGIPTEIGPFMQSDLVSMPGKLRALMDLFIPARTSDSGNGPEDESLGAFITRRLGGEVLKNIVEPLLAGIYAGNTHKLSLQATFPQFQEAEIRYGSLIQGTRINRQKPVIPEGQPEIAKKTVFLTFRQGLQSIVHGLIRELSASSVRLWTDTAAEKLQPLSEEEGRGYRLELDDGRRLEADTVIAATPAFVTAPLLAPHLDVDTLQRINYVSVANVVLAFEREDIAQVLDGSGLLVPRGEGPAITACTWTSAKWLHTSPDDKALLRCYVGRDGEEHYVDLPDEELIALVRNDLRHIMGLTAEPLFTEVTRLRRSMPQYPVGHIQALAAFRSQLSGTLPGVYITGAGYEGVGLPDCIRTAKETAEQAVKQAAERANA
ncbi:protoporphyrinogen oxidase [Paenibacillus sp. MSJ-34]|uniref:protoporphyrinogen oxidase n=1 Tax=Paenibacillus sp. MSJ-34 TaxID=2841529 RepID=UPI001C12897E|nr:protoporphyrinogen oxidase [Paenibacillus sp. MSJ-34]MBU5442064.1 protoporphyrinogen oxidase [Paenibacillus sp. MSJ-34]